MQQVLIACEEVTLQKSFEGMLAVEGITIRIINPAFLPLDCSDLSRTSLAIVDLSTQDANGFSTILSLRRTFPKMPIVAISACHDTVTKDHAHRCGATVCIYRPLDLYALVQLAQGLFCFLPDDSLSVNDSCDASRETAWRSS